ncbi:ABC transporter permease [Stutzerimonas azotifigens]|uniref:ABC transporter permease n=1 Tax=Stutzerimonas azotifigens TaxID=291995 RepID=UPI000413A379|nr:ABC transporter permease [Stutzerimonas azotifigens]
MTPHANTHPGAIGRWRTLPSAGRRAAVSLIVMLLAWELIAHSPRLFGFEVPYLGVLPAPSAVIGEWVMLLGDAHYWGSWYLSFTRVFAGFISALLLGVPLGLWFAISPTMRNLFFPVFEMLRPVPPIAWVPAAIIFWPTQELSIISVIFLGAFYTITLNTYNGGRRVDLAIIQSARSMGASRSNIFRRIVLPGTLPSIVAGAAIGMGITWEVVVAAELISGGNGGGGGGLGLFMWDAYLAGNHEQILVGMLSIGLAGYFSSGLLRRFGGLLTPWLSRN